MNCGHNCNLDITLKPRHNIDDFKIKEFLSSFPFLPQGWTDEEGEDESIGLQCEICVVHFKWIKGESGLIQSKIS